MNAYFFKCISYKDEPNLVWVETPPIRGFILNTKTKELIGVAESYISELIPPTDEERMSYNEILHASNRVFIPVPLDNLISAEKETLTITEKMAYDILKYEQEIVSMNLDASVYSFVLNSPPLEGYVVSKATRELIGIDCNGSLRFPTEEERDNYNKYFSL